MTITPEIRAQVLREAAAEIRRVLNVPLQRLPDRPRKREQVHCQWCEDHSGDCSGLTADDFKDTFGSNNPEQLAFADHLDDLAAREEGRAAHLAAVKGQAA